jgi:hypothetical protein
MRSPQPMRRSIVTCRALLCGDSEISKYARAVSRQRLGKHIPEVTDTHATIEALLETYQE